MRSPVHDNEEMRETSGTRKRPNKVYMNEVHYQSSDAVVQLGEASSKISDSKLSFRLSKSYTCIVSPELGEFEGYSMYTKSSQI